MCAGMYWFTCSRTTLAKPPLPDRFFDGLQQIVAFEFLDRHFGVARDVETDALRRSPARETDAADWR